MPPVIEPSTSSGDGIAHRLDELFEAIAHLTSDLGTTNKVLADTRADQVTLRAAVRDITGADDNKHGDDRKGEPDGGPIPRHRVRNDKPPDHGPRIRLDPPRFNGDNTEDWIDRVETYFDYNETPKTERLYLVRMLMDPPASA